MVRADTNHDSKHTEEYLLGRAAFNLQLNKADISGKQCPYQASLGMGFQRIDWLFGYYDEVVDECELQVRKSLGLPLVSREPEEKRHPVRNK